MSPLSNSAIEAAINCLRALSTDPREPERYREWYTEALAELEGLKTTSLEQVAPTDLFSVSGVCPRCGRGRLFGVLLRDARGQHQHTSYACAAWPTCLWTGFRVPTEEERDG